MSLIINLVFWPKKHLVCQLLALPENIPPNLYVLTVLWEDPNPPEIAGPHLDSLLREICVFWVWAKHSIWQFIKELHLPKCSEAEGPVGQGSVVRRGNCRWTQCITQVRAATSHSRALPVAAHDPSTGSSAQQGNKTGNVPLLTESGWHGELCDTRLWDLMIPNYGCTVTPTAVLLPSTPHRVFPPIYNQSMSCWRLEWSPRPILCTPKALTRSAGHYENRSQSCQFSARERKFFIVFVINHKKNPKQNNQPTNQKNKSKQTKKNPKPKTQKKNLRPNKTNQPTKK